MNKKIAVAALLPVIVVAAGIFGISNKLKKESLEAARIQAVYEELEAKKREEIRLKRETELSNAIREGLSSASEQDIRSLLDNCTMAVIRYTSKYLDSVFGVQIVRENSALEHQALVSFSPYSIESNSDRVASFMRLQAKTEQRGLAAGLNLSYVVIYQADTFSGPENRVRAYRCSLASDLSISSVNGI